MSGTLLALPYSTNSNLGRFYLQFKAQYPMGRPPGTFLTCSPCLYPFPFPPFESWATCEPCPAPECPSAFNQTHFRCKRLELLQSNNNHKYFKCGWLRSVLQVLLPETKLVSEENTTTLLLIGTLAMAMARMMMNPLPGSRVYTGVALCTRTSCYCPSLFLHEGNLGERFRFGYTGNINLYKESTANIKQLWRI